MDQGPSTHDAGRFSILTDGEADCEGPCIVIRNAGDVFVVSYGPLDEEVPGMGVGMETAVAYRKCVEKK